MRRTESHLLPSSSPGTRRELLVHRYGPSGGKKAVIQASLHADELPGILVAQHLGALLEGAELLGEVVVVPYANPIGLSQVQGGTLLGRYDTNSQENFNRRFMDFIPPLRERLAGQLGPDAVANVHRIREEMIRILEEKKPVGELETLRWWLVRLAVDADIVLDLHCDFAAVLHMYCGTPLGWEGADLAAELGVLVNLVAEESGGNPFDEALGAPWWAMAKQFPGVAVPPACFSATVELRGEADVSDSFAEQDAAAIFRFLQRRGLIAGDPGPLPPLRCEPTPLEGVQMLRSPATGLLVWKQPLGAQVRAGDVIAELVDPTATPGQPRLPLRAEVGGVLFGRVRQHLVRPGQIVAKIAGNHAFRSGHLLTD
ncbi:MAG TPA: M14 family metallopeptidase [Myxococcota bacterium]|nr:M14 family metallopeptidase [Myxococcota bacterium]